MHNYYNVYIAGVWWLIQMNLYFICARPCHVDVILRSPTAHALRQQNYRVFKKWSNSDASADFHVFLAHTYIHYRTSATRRYIINPLSVHITTLPCENLITAIVMFIDIRYTIYTRWSHRKWQGGPFLGTQSSSVTLQLASSWCCQSLHPASPVSPEYSSPSK